ncbi:hypothetical protein [Acetivibrio clariflavus]|uniref:hypothetical protein n=1 Tax=Acetivibrio clariflavus TaxID=288965 RepID=UPI000489DF33|nr:hypothetical protein [Acetivibrio clariflavus]
MQLASKPVYPAKATLEIKINGCNVTVNTGNRLRIIEKSLPGVDVVMIRWNEKPVYLCED